MPAYLELLPYILEDYTDDAFDIPFVDLAQNLALIVGCLIIGFAVSWWKPEFSAKAARIISPITYLILFALDYRVNNCNISLQTESYRVLTRYFGQQDCR